MAAGRVLMVVAVAQSGRGRTGFRTDPRRCWRHELQATAATARPPPPPALLQQPLEPPPPPWRRHAQSGAVSWQQRQSKPACVVAVARPAFVRFGCDNDFPQWHDRTSARTRVGAGAVTSGGGGESKRASSNKLGAAAAGAGGGCSAVSSGAVRPAKAAWAHRQDQFLAHCTRLARFRPLGPCILRRGPCCSRTTSAGWRAIRDNSNHAGYERTLDR
jgi:hypothetical protein